MAHFYANIQGNRGEATRMGTKASGIVGHIRGWDVGARISIDYDKDNDRDICNVYLTTGSNGYGSGLYLGRFSNVNDEIIKLKG